jgi:hypothetical protein
VRQPKKFQVPTKLRVGRTDDRLTIEVDPSSLEAITGEVGANMVTGMKHALRVYRGKELVVSGYGGLGGDWNVGTLYLNRGLDKIPKPGEKYTVEMDMSLFETDVPAQHQWAPESDRYKVLWSRTVKQDVE